MRKIKKFYEHNYPGTFDPIRGLKLYPHTQTINIKDIIAPHKMWEATYNNILNNKLSYSYDKILNKPSTPPDVIHIDEFTYFMREGYHRTMQHYLNGETSLKCNILKIGDEYGNNLENLEMFFKNLEIKENLYSHLKKDKIPRLKKVETPYPDAIKGGVILIISNPFSDGYRRMYMSLANTVREDNESETIRVDLIPKFYILKEHFGGKIMPETIEHLTNKQRMDILNMETSGLYLNDNKTPLWQVSCTMNKIDFFTHYQSIIKNLKNRYPNIIFPKTSMKDLPNLHL